LITGNVELGLNTADEFHSFLGSENGFFEKKSKWNHGEKTFGMMIN
jgi:hypothetical protein